MMTTLISRWGNGNGYTIRRGRLVYEVYRDGAVRRMRFYRDKSTAERLYIGHGWQDFSHAGTVNNPAQAIELVRLAASRPSLWVTTKKEVNA